MSARAVAFLRAVNVGGRIVKMDRLRAIFQTMGFESAETFIASGNVVFDPGRRAGRALETAIEVALETALGYPVEAFVRRDAEIAQVVRDVPFSPAEAAAAHSVLVGFIKTAPPSAARAAALGVATGADDFRFVGSQVYWLNRVPQSESKFSLAKFERAIDGPVTFRNVNTVRRLAAKYPAA